jgi:hypothetical protein
MQQKPALRREKALAVALSGLTAFCATTSIADAQEAVPAPESDRDQGFTVITMTETTTTRTGRFVSFKSGSKRVEGRATQLSMSSDELDGNSTHSDEIQAMGIVPMTGPPGGNQVGCKDVEWSAQFHMNWPSDWVKYRYHSGAHFCFNSKEATVSDGRTWSFLSEVQEIIQDNGETFNEVNHFNFFGAKGGYLARTRRHVEVCAPIDISCIHEYPWGDLTLVQDGRAAGQIGNF